MNLPEQEMCQNLEAYDAEPNKKGFNIALL